MLSKIAFVFLLFVSFISAVNADTAFTGAMIWDGSGAPLIEDATILVGNDGRISAIGKTVDIPANTEIISLTGKYVLPGFVNAHGHINGFWDEQGDRNLQDNMRSSLKRYARYGVTTINSLGDTTELIEVRDNDAGKNGLSRALASGPRVVSRTPTLAAEDTELIAATGVDSIKIGIDDALGTDEKMPWDAAQAVHDTAEANGLHVATHMFYLEDSKRLLEMGTHLLAHSVRDETVDGEFLNLMRSNNACYVPTLMREVSTFIYAEDPEFFNDPFFQRYPHTEQMDRVLDENFIEQMASSRSAALYRLALEQAQENIKIISDANLPIALGTDSGIQARFPGYFEHMELWMMVDAGLTPSDALLSATSVAADCLQLDDRGSLVVGRWADFIVFDENPLENIQATRSLESVYIAGEIVR